MRYRHLALCSLALLLGCGQRRDLGAESPWIGPATSPPAPAASVTPVTAPRPGAVPDYAEMEEIVTHTTLDDMAEQLSPVLTEVLGTHHRIESYTWTQLPESPADPIEDDDSTVWMRDYQPIYVRRPDGKLVVYRYLSQNPNRQRFRMQHAPHQDPAIEERRLPVLHENGNLVVAGRFVFLTESIVEENANDWAYPHLIREGYRPRTREELRRYLARRFFRKPDEIVFLPPMPFEATGHIDLYLLPLDDHTVVLPKIETDAFEGYLGSVRGGVAKVLQVFFDDQAEELEGHGLKVLRLPMVPPSVHDIEDETKAPISLNHEFEIVVYSPANSLLANVGGRHVFVPGFSRLHTSLDEQGRIARYTKQWMTTFEAQGWTPHLVDASGLASHLGLFRCVTASVPATK